MVSGLGINFSEHWDNEALISRIMEGRRHNRNKKHRPMSVLNDSRGYVPEPVIIETVAETVSPLEPEKTEQPDEELIHTPQILGLDYARILTENMLDFEPEDSIEYVNSVIVPLQQRLNELRPGEEELDIGYVASAFFVAYNPLGQSTQGEEAYLRHFADETGIEYGTLADILREAQPASGDINSHLYTHSSDVYDVIFEDDELDIEFHPHFSDGDVSLSHLDSFVVPESLEPAEYRMAENDVPITPDIFDSPFVRHSELGIEDNRTPLEKEHDRENSPMVHIGGHDAMFK